jgi:hypothetical protein
MKELKKVGESMYRILENGITIGWVSQGTDNLWYIKIIGQDTVSVTEFEKVINFLK